MRRILLLSWVIFAACDTSQFDPSAHRARYEKERLNSNVKRMQLTEDGRLPEQEAAPTENNKQ